MGNVNDREKGKKMFINSIVRKILSNEHNKNDNSEYLKRIKTQSKKISYLNLKNSNIINSSIIIAEEIIKSNLIREFSSNANIYSGLLVFKDIDQYENDDFDSQNINENEELSNLNQIISTQNILFPKDENFKNIQTILDLYIGNENQVENNFEINYNFNYRTSIEVDKNKGENKIQSSSVIQSTNNLFYKNESKTISYDISNSKINTKDRSFEDISLQEYLKMETDRLKNDQNYINYKKVKESNADPILKNMIEVDSSVSSLNDNGFHFDPNPRQKNMFSNYNFNILKNKHLDSKNKKNQYNDNLMKKSNSHRNKTNNLSNYNTSNGFSQTQMKNNWLNNKNNTQRNKSIGSSNKNLNENYTPNFSKTNYFDKPNSQLKSKSKNNQNEKEVCIDNFHYFSHRNPKIRSPENRSINYINNTTKNTSRPPSNSNRNKLNGSKLNLGESEENSLKIDLTTSGWNKSSSRKTTRRKSLIKASLDGNENLNTIESAKSNLVNAIKQKPPIASIKIDIRDLLKEDIEPSKKNSGFEEYLNKFENTNKSYSQILTNNNPEAEKDDIDIKDLIITKQKVDRNGNIIIF